MLKLDGWKGERERMEEGKGGGRGDRGEGGRGGRGEVLGWKRVGDGGEW